MAFFKKLMGGGQDDMGEIKVTSVEPPSAKAAAQAEAAQKQIEAEARERRASAQQAPPPSAAPPPTEIKEPEIEIYLREPYVLDDLLKKLVEIDGSDLHLAVGSPPCMRVHGELTYSQSCRLTEEMIRGFFNVIPEEKRQKMIKTGNADFGYEVKGIARFRGNCFRQHHGSSMVFRVIPSKIPTVEELNLPPILNDIAEMQRGLVVVTGPTGSGKSTTMAAMINHLNHKRKAHIITVEDPIEFFHPSLQCLIDHREVGEHAVSFADALRASLREDPDIILVGEMRDLETIYLAIKAAETGALVFGTLHTNSAAKTIDRIIDVFPAKQQNQIRSMLSDSLKAIVAQLLLKRCDRPGRVAVQEILLSREGFPNLVREGKTSQLKNYLMTGAQHGMQSMDTGLLTLLKAGKIDIYAVRELTNDPDFFDRMGYRLW
jgi:twitching motility protein PilT